MTDPVLSVVIATRDRAALLAGALQSLRAQIGAPPFEIVVVDNGSSDGTDAVARSAGATVLSYAEPNRAAARNRGLDAARGAYVVFVDDDVVVPAHFLRAHHAAHAASVFPLAVSGPIINVPSSDARPAPGPQNWSGAFFCTCNVSVPRSSLAAVGGFDESFSRYGWEDTELGVRLHARHVRRVFAWDAWVWHQKPPAADPLERAETRTREKARMAARFVAKTPTRRVRLATGDYAANRVRAALLSPRALLPALRAAAQNDRLPAPLRGLARARYLDGLYVDELVRASAGDAPAG